MSGNAYEWVNDRLTLFGYGPEPFGEGAGPRTDPVYGVPNPNDLTPSTPVFPSSPDAASEGGGFAGYRLLRGGSFDRWPILAASGYRFYLAAAVQYSGFRIARTLPPAAAKEVR
jgi:formylglycine-generating enzyme required for sulfatase activity